MQENKIGKIRVGRCIIRRNKKVFPEYKNYTPIITLTKCTKYGSLSPYELKNSKGQIMENIYQFQKIYKTIPPVHEIYSRFQQVITWSYPSQEHLKIKNLDGIEIIEEIDPSYWVWRNKGINNYFPVRYPAGFKNRHTCYGSIFITKETDTELEYELLNYIDSRKKIYLPEYTRLVKCQKQFQELKERINKGENLLIIEIDGPHEESLDYYKEKYNVPENFIKNSTTKVTKENMKIFLNDSKHPFGHGYCLGMALLEISLEDLSD